jgi:predicted ATP-binding protein involved in virulence
MCLSNFQSFGKETTEIQLDKITYLISPNGSGKTLNIRVLKPVRLQT